MNKEIAIAFINSNNHTGIKAGFDRPDFLNIWMVVVDNRIFARSWGFAEKSWYNTFLQNSKGQIKCGDDIFPIKAFVPVDNDLMTEKINSAYLTKYNSEHNIPYAEGIVRKEHADKTMEFIIDEE